MEKLVALRIKMIMVAKLDVDEATSTPDAQAARARIAAVLTNGAFLGPRGTTWEYVGPVPDDPQTYADIRADLAHAWS
jgi:hypothetical protein